MYRVRKRCLMTDIRSIASRKPVPPVNVDDLKRVWCAIRDITGALHHDPGQSVGIDPRLLEPYCEPGADVTAVSVRASLLRAFLQSGLLDEFREGDELRDNVFQVAAVFPMELGKERFKFPEFIERLRL
jgi:hypothetical protein